MSHRAISELLGWDPQKLSDLLTGKGGVDEIDFARLLGLCRVSEEEFHHLMALLKVSREKGWWQLYESFLPIQLRTLFEHEDVCTALTSWHLTLVPGLLQTPEYMRALLRVWPKIKPEDVEPRVEARVARQQILEPRRQFRFSSTNKLCGCRSVGRRCGGISCTTCCGCWCGRTSPCESCPPALARTPGLWASSAC